MRCIFLVFCFLGSMLFHIQESCSSEVDSLDPFSVEHVQRFLGEEWQVKYIHQTFQDGAAPQLEAKFVSKRNNEVFYACLFPALENEKPLFNRTNAEVMHYVMKKVISNLERQGVHVFTETIEIIEQTADSIVFAFLNEKMKKYSARIKCIISEAGIRKYSHYSDVLENIEEDTSYWKKKFSELH